MWKAKYTDELNQKWAIGDFKANGEVTVECLPFKKRGWPLLLGCELDDQVKSYINDLRGKGGNVYNTTIIACAEAMVNRVDKKLLKDNSGSVDLSKTFTKSLHWWKATTSAKVKSSYFEELKEQCLLDIKAAVETLDIPMDLIMNWDHTGVNIVPGYHWTMKEKGTKRVECTSLDDKCQITVVICATTSSIFLPSK